MCRVKIKIKQERIRQGISIRELSSLSGVSTSYISELESGDKNNPRIKIVCKIAKALRVTIDQLISCD